MGCCGSDVRYSSDTGGGELESIILSKGGHTLGEHEEGSTIAGVQAWAEQKSEVVEGGMIRTTYPPPKVDMVDHPPHYTQGKIECIEFIEDQKLGYHLGQAVAYIVRCRWKGTEREDVRKAIWYLERYLKEVENG